WNCSAAPNPRPPPPGRRSSRSSTPPSPSAARPCAQPSPAGPDPRPPPRRPCVPPGSTPVHAAKPSPWSSSRPSPSTAPLERSGRPHEGRPPSAALRPHARRPSVSPRSVLRSVLRRRPALGPCVLTGLRRGGVTRQPADHHGQEQAPHENRQHPPHADGPVTGPAQDEGHRQTHEQEPGDYRSPVSSPIGHAAPPRARRRSRSSD